MSENHSFTQRHIGINAEQISEMLAELGYSDMESFISEVVPSGIRMEGDLELSEEVTALSEHSAISRLRSIMEKNKLMRSLIGNGYYNSRIPAVIQRNILENPGWYTAYTPYQAEISQGRLEMCLNFQTMICDLTGLDVANASLLDEGSAAAEALSLCAAGVRSEEKVAFISDALHPHVIDVIQTRMSAIDIELVIGKAEEFDPSSIENLFAVILSYPDTNGEVHDWSSLIDACHQSDALVAVSCDLLALCLLKSPGEMGADIAFGNSQRFGVPLGFGGPHAAFLSVSDALKRRLPGRLIGVSVDSSGKPAYRLSLQTREQHIRRDKATSNICTAQVLLAVLAASYAIYHGPEGLKDIATRAHSITSQLAEQFTSQGIEVITENYFDTLKIKVADADEIIAKAEAAGFNLRRYDEHHVALTIDEIVTRKEMVILGREVFGVELSFASDYPTSLQAGQLRKAELLSHPIFHLYRSETEMMRYLSRLEKKDLALNTSMIPLGSCTMKLNAAVEMMPLTWAEMGSIHPYAPSDQTQGYQQMLSELEDWLCEITGFAAISLQPNAGSQGEYAGLLAIRRYHEGNGDNNRTRCLIPLSAHGTNPASAVMAGMEVIPVKCDEAGNIDLEDLQVQIDKAPEQLSALMVTYPSTHGVFEESIKEICQKIHDAGGQVYMDGANMNAQVGLTSPALIGADVCHLNLHKTFCIPHGGGGPGVGPIGVAAHLQPYLPGHETLGDNEDAEGAVCSAAYGSASICSISWMYIAMMGNAGLKEATEAAILNANYIAKRLDPYFPVLYKGSNGLVAHECIIDLRQIEEVGVEDVAKRLIDYGFHAPTMSFPVTGTLMIEPTESESRAEIDRFCDSMISIHGEIEAIRAGMTKPDDNPLVNAPHTAEAIANDDWRHRYTREEAVFPAQWLRENKYWCPVGRVDNVHGDRNLICSCPPMEEFEEATADKS